jgi:hypothetical protein
MKSNRLMLAAAVLSLASAPVLARADAANDLWLGAA